MPKPFGFTKRGQILAWLNAHQGLAFYTRDLAAQFATTPANVAAILRELEINGWDVRRQSAGRSISWTVQKST